MDMSDIRKVMPEMSGEGIFWLDGPALEQRWSYWWRSPLGTYKSERPRESGHTMVGHQETLRITGRIYGLHPELGGAMGASEQYEWTDIDMTRELPDVFYPERSTR